ncbi:MAG: hypothetical protein ABIU54_08350 [Candidatus Eisenbacteria bacterium]
MRALLRLALPLAALSAFAYGCGAKGTLRPDLAPETTLFVNGAVDTVNHVVKLYWFGTDVDGTVSGYELRFLNPVAPADTNWVFTTRTDSVFTVPSPSGFAAPVFEVRSVDNAGQRDPSPARQDFSFSNQPPSVALTLKPGVNDTTFASVTVSWNANDPDGDGNLMQFRLWLDGNEANPEITSARTFTMPTAQFRVAGALTSAYRKLYVQAIDDGGRGGNVDSVRWFVRKPTTGDRARLLIVDDVPTTNTSNARFDSLFTNNALRNIPPGEFSILRMQTNQPFKSAKDVEQTFKLFEAVMWYRANEITFSTILNNYQAGIGAYLDGGGKMYLEGLYLIAGLNGTGPLNEDFVPRYLNCDGMLKTFAITGSFSDSTIGWGNLNGSRFRSTVMADSSRQQGFASRTGEASGLRTFRVRDNDKVLLWALPGQLTPANPDSLPVGVIGDVAGGGRMILTTVPISTTIPPATGTAPRLLAKVLQLLGVLGP